MPSATITSKGQTTIPKKVREHLKVDSGDQIDFIIQADGSVIVRPATIEVSELKGILHRKKMKVVSIHAMNSAIRNRFRR